MVVMMAVVGALTTIACVAVAIVPVQWLEEMERRRGGCHQCGCGKRRERSGRRDLGSMTELPNRSLLGVIDDNVPIGRVGDATSTMGSLQTPLLQG
jgi:hypothetical protein